MEMDIVHTDLKSILMIVFFDLKKLFVAGVIFAGGKLITEVSVHLAAIFQHNTLQTVFIMCYKVEIYLHTKYIKSRRDDLQSTMFNICT